MNIALIGGGPCAAVVIEHLASAFRAAHQKAALTIFDANPERWVGRAYQPDLDVIRLNAPLSIMSLRSWDPHHAVRWYSQSTGNTWESGLMTEQSFPPRALYGEYLKETLTATLSTLGRQGWHAEMIPEMVTQACAHPEGFSLETSSGHFGRFSSVVLCIGNEQRSDPYGLGGMPKYISDPYPLVHSLTAIPRSAHVGVLGTGLTAADIVVALRARKHQGPITLFSRHGLLPWIRRPVTTHTARFLTRSALSALVERDGALTLQSLSKLCDQELHTLGGSIRQFCAELSPVQGGIEHLKNQMQRLRSPQIWQHLFRQTIAQLEQEIWPLLPETEREQFLHSSHTSFLNWRIPMPCSHAEKYLQLAQTGQLTVLGEIEDIFAASRGGFIGKTQRQECKVDVLINATASGGYRVPAPAVTLINSLPAQGVACLHPQGGLRVQTTTCRCLNGQGQVEQGLFAVGDITRGTFYHTSGIDVMTPLAQKVAQTLVAEALGEGIQSASAKTTMDMRGERG